MIQSKPYKKKVRDCEMVKVPTEFKRLADINRSLLGISRVDYFRKLTDKLKEETKDEFKRTLDGFNQKDDYEE